MPTSLIVVDDFLGARDAQSLRHTALGLTYPDTTGALPGRESLERIEIPGLDRTVSQLVGERVVPVAPPQPHAAFRITLAGDAAVPPVHVDQAYWSGVLYLSRPEDCSGGTSFFRHRATGSDGAPLDAHGLQAMGYATHAEMHREVIERDSGDRACWEPTMQVPMRFNRLVLLRPWLWHTAGPAFGDRMDNGRLVYLVFFSLP